MAASPQYKVYIDGEYRAACKYAEDAAIIVAAWSHGDIRDGHSSKRILWVEGAEEFSAGQSYDGAAEVICKRQEARRTSASAHPKTKHPTFVCGTCDETFKATKTNGEWYGVRDEHFQAVS